MAEREDKNHYPNQHYRRNFRGRSNHHRIYNNLGVKDLRELLDRKRSEQANLAEAKVPPPDPSYNYLKDPSRESHEQSQHHQQNYDNRRSHPSRSYQNHPRRGNYHHQSPNSSKSQDIENPMNIKVEFSTSTGAHSYTLDKETVLPTIKHIPDQVQSRPFNNRGRGSFRGRSRGRGGRQNNRSRGSNKRAPSGANTDEKDAEEGDNSGVGVEEEVWEIDDTKNGAQQGASNALEEEIDKAHADSSIDGLEKEIENMNIEERNNKGPAENNAKVDS